MRRMIGGGFGIALLAGVTAGALIHWSEPEVVRVYHGIQLGMTRAEAEAAIGEPPTPDPGLHALSVLSQSRTVLILETGIRTSVADYPPGVFAIERCYWGRHLISLVFDGNGKAVHKKLQQLVPPPTLLDRARAGLGL